MADSQHPDPTIEGAIKKRRELSEQIRKALYDIEEIEQLLRLYRKHSVASFKGGSEAVDEPERGVGRAAQGMTQALFEHLAREILRERGEPLQSPDFIEEFAKRGYPIGGANEQKQTWNRLWQAKTNGVLTHFPKPGYWLADEPVPESPAVRGKAEVAAGRRSPNKPKSPRPYTGKPRGRTRLLNEQQLIQAGQWIDEGRSIKEIAAMLNVSPPTIYKHMKERADTMQKELALAQASSDEYDAERNSESDTD